VSLRSRTLSYQQLADIPFFAGWTPDELAAVEGVAERVDYPARAHLGEQGTTAYEFIVILSGEADVVVDGHVVAELGPGDHVGEMPRLDGSPRNASVVAVTPVRALMAGSRAFRALVDQVPSLDRKLLVSLTHRLGAHETA
jgi:CRP/FNR family cyclic AMP-dependent transcriptional regulator